MTIETLKPGDPARLDRKFLGECRRCKGRFRFEARDASRVHMGDMRDGPFAQIKCPTTGCGDTVTGYPERQSE